MVKIMEYIWCISRDGKRLGYKKRKKQQVIKYQHTFQLGAVADSSESEKNMKCYACDQPVIGDKKKTQFVGMQDIRSIIKSNNQECSVCCSPIVDNFYITKCNHVFHLECIVPWYTRQNTCPLCREADIKLPLHVSLV